MRRCGYLLVALSGHAWRYNECPLLGVKRTWGGGRLSASDPTRISTNHTTDPTSPSLVLDWPAFFMTLRTANAGPASADVGRRSGSNRAANWRGQLRIRSAYARAAGRT